MSGSNIAVCDEHYQLCSLCNAVTNAAAHTGGAPHCLNVGTCTTCDVEYLPTDPVPLKPMWAIYGYYVKEYFPNLRSPNKGPLHHAAVL